MKQRPEWLILKAAARGEDLCSADGSNMFCQAFEIQMTPSTRCPADGFESSHEKGGGGKKSGRSMAAAAARQRENREAKSAPSQK